MIVSGMVKSSLVDFPGLVSCILFTPGCNYNCFYCHNRELISGKGAEILDQSEIDAFLKKRVGKLDGVVITGGEPTLQKDLIDYIKNIKALGYKVKLDTNGSDTEIIKRILDENIVDYFAIDYKAPAERYKEICGRNADARPVIETINMLLERGVSFEIRTTVVPQFSLEDLMCMAKELPIVPRYVLNRYRKPEKYEPQDKKRIEQRPYTQSEIENFVKALKDIQPNIMT